MIDYHSIILWNSNEQLAQIIQQEFKDKIIKTIVLDLGELRQEKIKQLYSPIVLNENDARLYQNSPITIFILTLNPASHFEWRTEGYRLCNSEILAFKKNHRHQFDYTVFHCTDNVLETEDVLRVFEIKDILPSSVIIPIDKLYHFIHDGYSYEDTYENKKYRLVKVKHSPVVKYLIGDKAEYINCNKLFNPREDSIDYHKSMGLTQSHEHCKIYVCEHNGKYVVLDGMHRSSILYFNGDRHILAHHSYEESTRLCKYLSDDDVFKQTQNNSHLENFHETIFRLNNERIRYIVIRGFHYMPEKPNTDLDIVVHPDDFIKFANIMDRLANENRIKFCDKKAYNKDQQKFWYCSYQTNGELGDHLPNNCYQLDIYSDTFYFGGVDKAVVLNYEFREHLFNNLKKFHHLNVPGIHSELVLLVCRVCIDKGGVWSEKHKARAIELIKHPEFGRDEFLRLLKLATIKMGNDLIEAGKMILNDQ